MAHVVNEVRNESPRETVVVDRDRDDSRVSNGVIVALIVIGIILLLVLFGGRLFGGGGDGGANINVDTPSVGGSSGQ
jgi:hypothetical protein